MRFDLFPPLPQKISKREKQIPVSSCSIVYLFKMLDPDGVVALESDATIIWLRQTPDRYRGLVSSRQSSSAFPSKNERESASNCIA